MSSGTFTLTGLSPLFTGATPAVTTIKVVTLSEMDFMDFSGTGSLGSVAVGDTVSVKGLLFNTTGMPTLVTRTLRTERRTLAEFQRNQEYEKAVGPTGPKGLGGSDGLFCAHILGLATYLSTYL